MDVAAWLRGLGLERYEAAFRDNEIDWEALPKLTAEDLKDLGVVLGSDRRKLLEAIGTLRGKTDAGADRTSAVATAERRQLTVRLCHGNEGGTHREPKLAKPHAAVTALFHCAAASVRNFRSDRETRWR